VQIQSTWFPLVDRNTGRFQDIYSAQAEDYQPTTQHIHRSAGHPTHLVLPVLKDR
jgi:predicted acyl esterase